MSASVVGPTGWVPLTAGELPDTAVTPGSYGDASHVAAITVDQQGRLTAASSVGISGAALDVTDGATTVASVTEISFSGATVSSGGAGIADVAVTGGGGGALTQLFDSTLGADAANIDATGLSTAYKQLLIYISARSTRAGISVDQVGIRFNGDTAGNYYYEALVATGAGAVSGTEGNAVTSAQPSCPAATATAGYFAGIVVDVIDYAATSHIKNGNWRSSYIKSTTTGNMVYDAGMFSWASTAAISQVTIYALNGNLKSGSRLTIYAA